MSPPRLPLAYSAVAMLEVLSEHPTLTSATGPLHLLFSLPGTLFPHRAPWPAPWLPVGLCSNATASEKSSQMPHLRQPQFTARHPSPA